MIAAIALLLLCQLAGDIIHRACHLPLPAPVIGMVLLSMWLMRVRKARPTLAVVTVLVFAWAARRCCPVEDEAGPA